VRIRAGGDTPKICTPDCTKGYVVVTVKIGSVEVVFMEELSDTSAGGVVVENSPGLFSWRHPAPAIKSIRSATIITRTFFSFNRIPAYIF
jgi:hypothetical protein